MVRTLCAPICRGDWLAKEKGVRAPASFTAMGGLRSCNVEQSRVNESDWMVSKVEKLSQRQKATRIIKTVGTER